MSEPSTHLDPFDQITAAGWRVAWLSDFDARVIIVRPERVAVIAADLDRTEAARIVQRAIDRQGHDDR